MASVIFEEHVRIPLGLATITDFRRWALSDAFPQTGRIDFVCGDIEVDMSPEELFSHGTLKGEIYATLLARVKKYDLGFLFTDSTRVSHDEAAVSSEPDIVFLSHEALDAGRVRLVPKASGEPDRYVEIDGSPDLVVEIVSDASYTKDTQRLIKAYYHAGIQEYWIIDARGKALIFQLHGRGAVRYEPVGTDTDGFQLSAVLGCRYCLVRRRSSRGYWEYELQERESC
jgi:Uma2 family endonuclease